MVKNLCFTLFVIAVLVFTLIAATYQPEDPLFHPSSKITTFLTSNSNATFKSDIGVVKTGEDFVASNQTAFATFINITDVDSVVGGTLPEEATKVVIETNEFSVNDPIYCRDADVFHLSMKFTIERFQDIHFYRFGKPVAGENASSCRMAWLFRPKGGKAAPFYKDYRRFSLERSENCTLSVVGIGEYHSGGKAGRGRGKNREKDKEVFEKVPPKVEENQIDLPEVGETVDNS